MQPPRNIRTWKVKYLIIPSSITYFRWYGFTLQPGSIGAGQSRTYTNTVATPFNTAGGCSILVAFIGFRVTLGGNEMSVCLAVTLISSTTIQLILTNKASNSISYSWCCMAGLIFNMGEINAGGIITVLYGSLTNGNSFSDSSITGLNTFYGIR
jgi:hypothetical protein